MELRFECTNCGQRISASPAQIGTAANCPSCGNHLTVPNPLSAVTMELPKATAQQNHNPNNQTSTSRVKAFKYRYIALLLCVLTYYYQESQLSKVSLEYVENAELLKQMDSGEYFAGMALESFIRGANGDPLGKANEELVKRNLLESRQAEIMQTVRYLSGWILLCWIVGLISGFYIIYRWMRPDSTKSRITA